MSKTALITGASRGIGKAIATQFAKEGYELYLICHSNLVLLEELAKNVTQNYSCICHCYAGDIADASFVERVFQDIDQLDLLINNAGISHIGLLTDMTDEQWHHIIDSNLSSVFYTSRAAAQKMLTRHSGCILNISSVWGNVGASMEVAYCASKGGVNAFTKALAKELAPSNIQVNAIACGVIDTDMNRCFSKEEMDLLVNEIPADRIGQPQEVALLASHLVHSPAYLTGQIINLDGGWQ